MKAYIVSLGCPKNLTDTEVLMGKLQQEGYSFTNNPAAADLILVNTCAFLQSAKQEALKTIKGLAKYKGLGTRGQGLGKCKYLIAAGCLPQRYKHELPKLLPEVDAFIGTPQRFHPSNIKATPPWYAYVKIAEGCGNRCAYCVVPQIRGPLRIRPMNEILQEVALLAKTGVKEIIFVAQDTAAYPNFPGLLKKTAKIKGVQWIRVLYAHPAHVTDKLLNVIASERKIVKYLDLPIQHINDKILKRMRRRYARQELEKLIDNVRRRKIALRTSVIVGFPGEGEAEFAELLGFIRKVKFEKLGVFTYSKEEGTPAYKMRGQVSAKEKAKRFHKIMRAQARVSKELNGKLIGERLDVMIERVVRGGYVGRSYMDAPEIDGSVLIKSQRPLKPGEIVKIQIQGSRTYDLIGFAP
ncbi:MAG: MiaB/RimO family radical SAM methylthiotransferase [Candidatus Margulisbacteria bacterium]|nr:MiaB/RimO family radical SAM methylthiotransferase [Candidatus Margulisiibacteriota bacterium]